MYAPPPTSSGAARCARAARRPVRICVAGAALLLLACAAGDPSPPREPPPGAAAAADSLRDARRRFSLVTGEVRFDPAPGGDVTALVNPRHRSTERAGPAEDLSDDEWVIGVASRDSAIAYPIRTLARHEVVNDRIGPHLIAVTWSPRTASGACYVRRLAERPLTIGVSSHLWRNHRVLFDAETRSLWSQILGECLAGELEGQRLGMLPCVLVRWGDWRRAYPATLLLDEPGEPVADRDGARGPFDSVEPVARDTTDLMPPGAGVIGVLAGRTAKAYPLSELRRRPVAMDDVAGHPVVLFLDPASGAVTVFSRDLGGLKVFFDESAPGGEIRDIATGSRWDWLRGEAVDGKMQGVSLVRVAATPACWSAWRDVFPRTEVYRAPRPAGPGRAP